MAKIQLSPNQKIIFISIGIVALIFIIWLFNFKSFAQRNLKKEDALLRIFHKSFENFPELNKPKNNLGAPATESKIDDKNLAPLEILKQNNSPR
ncbi:MAG: hypothetical protein AAB465_03395 [Patescibacteria group bacterium]